MKYSDAGFEEFQKALGAFRESDPLLWRLRDSLYAALCYRMIGFQLERRHAARLWSWIPWAVWKALRGATSRKQIQEPGADFGFLFSGSHSAHFETLLPVAREIAEDREVIAWAMAMKPEQVALLAGMKNVRVILLTEPLRGQPATETLRHALTALRASFRLDEIFPEWKGTTTAHRSLLAQVIFDYLAWRIFWQERQLPSAGGAVFVTSEGSVLAKALIDAARAGEARAIHFCHGLRQATHQVTKASDLCVFSEMDRRWFAERVEAGTSVQAIGNPRIESIASSVPPLRPRHPGEPFRLLFLSTGVEDPYTDEMMRTDCAILAADEPTRAKYVLRLRPHPRESIAELGRSLAQCGLRVDEISSGALTDDLAWCDAAATQCSTSLLEAMVAQRPCYWINARAEGMCGTGELQSAGLGLLIQSTADWSRAANALFEGKASPPAVITGDILRSTGILSFAETSWLKRLKLRPLSGK